MITRPFLFILLLATLSCRDRPGALHPVPSCPSPVKIPVYKENVFDLNGYADEGKGDPFALFDENALVDPAHTRDGYLPHTNPQPTQQPAIYFPRGKGNRIVIDLQTAYRLTDIYCYDRSRSRDSVWIYVGDMQHWRLAAAFTTISYFEPGRWQQFQVKDSARYCMIRFSSYKTAITEMVLYGCPYGAVPPPPARSSAPPGFTGHTMKEFLGVNDYSAMDPKWLAPFYYSRMYSFAVDFDPDTVHAWPDVRYNMTHFGHWDDSRRDYDYPTEENVRQNHHVVWYTMQGLPMWMAKKEQDGKNRPVTQWGMDAEDPLSYARHAGMMWTLAAWFGNTRWDSGALSLDHRVSSTGRGTMHLYENGNEEDAFWAGEKYCNPLAYFAQSNADYDGAEGALGKKCGIHNADSSSALITSGLISLDTNRVKVYKFLCSTLRKDKAFLWKGGVQYHHYSTNDTHGLTPEEDSLRWRLSRVKAFTDALEPGVPCILGENGYDKSQYTRQSTPLVPGLSKEECQALFILRSMNATAFSGFDAYVLYWLKDTRPAEDSMVYQSSGVIRVMPDGSVKPYPSWYYINTFERRLADYYPYQVVSESGKVWVYKYRNRRSPDSVAYFIYAPSHSGTTVAGYSLSVGHTAGDGLEVGFSPDSIEGHTTPKKATNGAVVLTVEEKPRLVMVREVKP